MKQYFFAIGNFLLGFLVLVLLILPKNQDVKNLKTESSQKRVDLQNEQDYSENIRSLHGKLEKYGPELAKISSSLPGDPSMPSLLDFIQKTASREGLVLGKINFGKTVLVIENPKVEKTEVFIGVDGPYTSFKKFVSGLEKSSRLIQTESLSFSIPEKGEVFTFSLLVSANFLPE
ncbi:MAG: type 4a pilus biogenesis protein PilO [bacterium]|nr:type 4a pilus biogenesis protein PilO [bacterium]